MFLLGIIKTAQPHTAESLEFMVAQLPWNSWLPLIQELLNWGYKVMLFSFVETR